MGHAVHSDLSFVQYPNHGNGCCCNGNACVNGVMIYRSVWDRLVQQLFGATPPDIDSEDQLPDIKIWKDGVELVDDSNPYTFHVTTPDGEQPRPYDVVLYKGKYYVIGAVDE